MLRIQSLILVALFVIAALASPIQSKKRSFKISRIRQRNYVPNGAIALRKAYTKFGINGTAILPELDEATTVVPVSKAAASTSSNGSESGEVTASPTQDDAEFLSPVSVGGQTLVMDFDTGSSDMWVFNTNLPSSMSAGHTIYDPTKSTTSQAMQGASFNISYGDGSFATGAVGTDTVNIGGAIAPGQAIGLPSSVAASFTKDTASNGLVGLAFSTLNTVKPQQQKTFFANVMGDLAQPVFTANLKHGTAGAYEFGAVDSTQFSGSLTTVPIDSSQGFWQFTSTKVAIGNGTAQAVQGGSGIAIADTGTSLLIVDQAVVQAYWGQVTGAQNSAAEGGVVFPCDATLPDISLAIGDSYMATVSGSLLNFASAGSDSESGAAYCFGALQSNAGADLQIYGDILFKSQFVAFDGATPSISMAPHAT